MVSFKNLLFITSLFVSGIAAIPTGFVERDVESLDSLERRTITGGKDANNILETQSVSAAVVAKNGGQATVTDLTGCTGIFFYKGQTLLNVAHIFCDSTKEEADAESVADVAESGSPDHVLIGANSQTHLNNVEKGIKAIMPGIKVTGQIYTFPAGKAATLHAGKGSTKLTVGVGNKISKQQPS